MEWNKQPFGANVTCKIVFAQEVIMPHWYNWHNFSKINLHATCLELTTYILSLGHPALCYELRTHVQMLSWCVLNMGKPSRSWLGKGKGRALNNMKHPLCIRLRNPPFIWSHSNFTTALQGEYASPHGFFSFFKNTIWQSYAICISLGGESSFEPMSESKGHALFASPLEKKITAYALLPPSASEGIWAIILLLLLEEAL